MTALKDLRKGTAFARNCDMAWERLLDKKSAERLIGVALRREETATGYALHLLDEEAMRRTRRSRNRTACRARCAPSR